MNIKKITNFIFEMGQMKKITHHGFKRTGIKHPDTIAEHSLRAAQIGYILAIMEGANPEKVATMLVIHDNAETRIGDQDKIAARYYDNGIAEMNAFEDQLELLGENIKKKWLSYFKEYENRTTKEGIVAKDADWLEQAFQAKEYVDMGFKSAQNWIDNVAKGVETESAKRIIKELQNTEFTDWWKNLKKITYKKLK